MFRGVQPGSQHPRRPNPWMHPGCHREMHREKLVSVLVLQGNIKCTIVYGGACWRQVASRAAVCLQTNEVLSLGLPGCARVKEATQPKPMERNAC